MLIKSLVCNYKMDQNSLIPVVKWAKKGFAAELPVFQGDNGEENERMELEKDGDDYDFDNYDAEDSITNKRPPSSCVRK